MDIGELRIGNWVECKRRPCKVVGLDVICDDATIRARPEGHGTYVTSKVFPIPLTDEILEKCGFDKYMDENGVKAWFFPAPYYRLIKHAHESWYAMTMDNYDNGETAMKLISNLHQLQNAYHFFTMDELKINFGKE